MSVSTRSPALTRPEGSEPADFHLSRRGLGVALFGGYAAFSLSAQAEPIVTDTQGLITDTASVPEGGGVLPAYIARPEASGRFPVVLVVSEVFGVHAYIQDVCRRFAKLGYVAIAPDFFIRADQRHTLSTTKDFKEIQRIVATASNEQVLGDIGATLDWLGRQPFVDRRRQAITGFCWGGAAVWMACARYSAFNCGVAWYGRLSRPAPSAFLGSERRPWPLDIVPELRAPMLGLYGGQDKGIPESDIDAMRAALKADGKQGSDLIVYPQAQHGFHADYRESYDPAAAKDSWARCLAFLDAHHCAPGVKHGFFG